jgi:hypothetical protein
VQGDPLADISALRQVRRVMLNGTWVDLTAPPSATAPTTGELLLPATTATQPAGS